MTKSRIAASVFVAASVAGALAATTAHATVLRANGRIVFASDATGEYDLHTMNARRGGVVRLTNSPLRDIHAQWSPDGQKIAFERFNAAGGADIWVMNGDGSGQAQLTHSPGLDAQPSWFPDRL